MAIADAEDVGRSPYPLPPSRFQPYPVNPPFDLSTELKETGVTPDRPDDSSTSSVSGVEIHVIDCSWPDAASDDGHDAYTHSSAIVKALVVDIQLFCLTSNSTRTVPALLDTGATDSVMRLDAVLDGMELHPSSVCIKGVFSLGQPTEQTYRTVCGVRRAGVTFPNLSTFATTSKSRYPVILGMDWLQAAKINISMDGRLAVSAQGIGSDGCPVRQTVKMR